MAVVGSILASAGVSTAVAAYAGTLIGGLALTHFLVTAAIGLSPGSRGYQVTQFGPAQDRQFIYGRARVGGVRVFDGVTGDSNKYLHRVLVFTGHEIESFEDNKIYIDNEAVTLDGNGNVTSPAKFDGFVRINKHLGTATQAADADLVAEYPQWTSAHTLKGCAYLYVRLKYDQDVFPNGVPEITAIIKGKKVYDPRTGTTAWSDNPALCIRDYLTSSYGLNEIADRIDDNLVIAAANVCDEENTIAATTRYTFNGAWTTGSTPYDLLGQFIGTMGGLLWYSQGEWKMRPAYWVAPELSFDEGDLIAPIAVSTRITRRDNYNTVRGTFRGEESNWQATDFPPVSNAAFVSVDNGEERSLDLNLAFTDNSIEARRIALINLERNRQQLTVQAKFGFSGFQAGIGDNIKLSIDRFGWADKEFEVIQWTFGFNDAFSPFVDMTLREISESVFDEVSDGLVYEKDNTTLYDPFDVPEVGISASVSTTTATERVLIVLELDVTSARASEIYLVEVQYKANAETEYKSVGTGELGIYRVVDIEDGIYDIRARAINVLGVRGEWTTLADYYVDPAVVTVSDVTNFSYNLSGGFITLNWDAVTDPGLSYYRIRHALEETGAIWANATTAVDKVSRPATSITLPARPGTYFIRAFSKTGTQSETATSVIIPETYLDDFTTTLTQTDSTTFTGTKTGTAVDTSELELSSFATAPSDGEYEFSTYIDTSSTRRVRARIDLETRRKDDTAGLFDDLSGNFDSLPGLFDDLTGFNQVSDTNVITYIAVTDDDPAGTPTWSSWNAFQAGEYFGRAFKFKIKLTSTSDNVTPAIDTLTARVQYS
jgi:hypothetical protein